MDSTFYQAAVCETESQLLHQAANEVSITEARKQLNFFSDSKEALSEHCLSQQVNKSISQLTKHTDVARGILPSVGWQVALGFVAQ